MLPSAGLARGMKLGSVGVAGLRVAFCPIVHWRVSKPGRPVASASIQPGAAYALRFDCRRLGVQTAKASGTNGLTTRR